MSRMFNFTPTCYAAEFAEHGYVHIRQGLREEFYTQLVRSVQVSFQKNHMKDFALGEKQQAIFEFPEAGHYDMRPPPTLFRQTIKTALDPRSRSGSPFTCRRAQPWCSIPIMM